MTRNQWRIVTSNDWGSKGHELNHLEKRVTFFFLRILIVLDKMMNDSCKHINKDKMRYIQLKMGSNFPIVWHRKRDPTPSNEDQ